MQGFFLSLSLDSRCTLFVMLMDQFTVYSLLVAMMGERIQFAIVEALTRLYTKCNDAL